MSSRVYSALKRAIETTWPGLVGGQVDILGDLDIEVALAEHTLTRVFENVLEASAEQDTTPRPYAFRSVTRSVMRIESHVVAGWVVLSFEDDRPTSHANQLTFSRWAVRTAGGTVEASSLPHAGSRVTMMLPLAA